MSIAGLCGVCLLEVSSVVPWFVRLRPFVGDFIVLSSIVLVVRRFLIRVSSDGEASDWEFSMKIIQIREKSSIIKIFNQFQ